MAKKRQPDFQPVKLKPGRSISKTANVLNTRFKAKKIAMPNKATKPQKYSTNTISGCMEIIKGNSNPGPRKGALFELRKLILSNPGSLPSHLSDVLEHVLRLNVDIDENVRNAASDIISTILANTADLHLQSFASLFIGQISCCMTHPNMKVKGHSIKLLTPILKYQPSLICHSIEILNHLLHLLIGSPRTRNVSEPKSKNVSVFYSDDLFSPDWRIHILGHIDVYLKEMLKSKLAKLDKRREEQEVYWDSKTPLYLPLYAEGGLKPFDIEKYYYNNSIDLCEDSDELLKFMEDLVEIIPSVYVEETAYETKSDDRLFDYVTIKNISTVFQIYCSLTDWPESNSNHLNESIAKFLKGYVYDRRQFPFIPKGSIFGEDKQGLACMQLNLYVIYLFFTHLSDSLKENSYLLESVLNYMKSVYKMGPEMKYQCIPMLVQVTKMFFAFKDTHEISGFLHSTMSQLFSLLKLYDDDENKQLLVSFFEQMSLEPAYGFAVETDVMKLWFKWLLNEPFEMVKTGSVNKDLLKIIKKIANRRYPCFQKCLAKIKFEQLLGLLKSDSDEVCDTVIFLIYNMEKIDTVVLNNIAELISSEDGIRTLFAVRLLRLLTYRFYTKPENGKKSPEDSIHSGKGLIVFIQFLLNVAIDSFNLKNDKFISYDTNEYTDAVKLVKGVIVYNVIPSLHWKQHSPIFEVCIGFLNQFPETLVFDVSKQIFNEILDNFTVLPMHCVIAIFQLIQLGKEEKYYTIQICYLIFASLLTMSILTHMSLDEDWFQCNILELTNSMELNNQLAIDSLQSVEYLKEDGYDSLTAFYMLRICRYFTEKQLLDENNAETVLGFLQVLLVKCSEKTLKQQPLFTNLYKHFTYFL